MAVSQTSALSAPVTVHGIVIGPISPLKTNKTKNGIKYFDCSFTNRLVY